MSAAGLRWGAMVRTAIVNRQPLNRRTAPRATLFMARPTLPDRSARTAFTIPELAVVLAVAVCLLAAVAPYGLQVWEKARQNTCRMHLKTLGQGVIEHQADRGAFPPGQLARWSKVDSIGRFADPQEPRAAADKDAAGASWALFALPYVDRKDLFDAWNLKQSVAANRNVAETDLGLLYCPSRRSGMRAGSWYSACERVEPDWTRGGNDYAACSGSGITFNDSARQSYSLTAEQLEPTLRGTVSPWTSFPQHQGIFGVNSRVTRDEVSQADGLRNVILLAERRLFTRGAPPDLRSSDGWAFGGPATQFSTRFAPHTGLHYDEADSEHPGLVHVCLADARVRAINWNIDLATWNNLGNYRQGAPIVHPDFLR